MNSRKEDNTDGRCFPNEAFRSLGVLGIGDSQWIVLKSIYTDYQGDIINNPSHSWSLEVAHCFLENMANHTPCNGLTQAACGTMYLPPGTYAYCGENNQQFGTCQ